jgi:hypothetical protein
MIGIVNVGPPAGVDEEESDLRCYEVRLCGKRDYSVVARFRHRRAEGMAVCLRHAADAVEGEKMAHIERLLERLMEPPGPGEGAPP